MGQKNCVIFLLLLTISYGIAKSLLGKSSEAFSSNLYQKLAKQDGNFVFSPSSLQTILALSLIGSKHRTLQEIASVSHLPENKGDVEELYKTTLPLFSNVKHSTLKSVNKIYVGKGRQPAPNFQLVSENSFGAEVESLDFTNSDQAVNEINRWVEINTNQKIKNFLPFVKPDTSMILINALFFIGEWDTPFQTVGKLEFYKNLNSSVPHEMMNTKEEFFYKHDEELNAKYLILPYVDMEFIMTLVIPNDINGLPLLESRIHKVFKSAERDLTTKHLDVVMPKFRIEQSTDFKEVLIDLGMKEPFEMTADFPNMLVNQTEGLYISRILQKTFIDVNELGTEAGSVTAGLFTTRIIPPKFELLKIDRPFLFYLTHVGTGVVQFMGRYSGP